MAGCTEKFSELMRRGEYEQALQYASEWVARVRGEGEKLTAAEALVCLADAQRFLDRNDESLGSAREAEQLLTGREDTPAVKVHAEALRAQADALRMANRWEEGLAVARRAEAMARQVGHTRVQVDALRAQTTMLLNADLNDEALEAGHAGLALAREGGYLLGQATLLDNLSDIMLKLEQREQSLALAIEAEGLCEQVGDRLRQANALQSQTHAYRELERLDEALATAIKAQDLYGQVGDRLGQGYALRAEAEALLKLGRHEEALGQAEQAREFLREVGSKMGQANSLRVQADALRALGQAEAAVARAREAEGLFEQASNRQGMAEALIALALAATDLGRKEEAEEAARRAQALFVESGMPGMADYAEFVADSLHQEAPTAPGQRAIARLHEEYGAQLGQILANAEKAEDAWHRELRKPRQPDCAAGTGEFVVLRQWPSYATLSLLPYPDEVAGGYLLRWGDRNLVIDPGLGFLAALRQGGFHLTDIDGVAVTHWHIDHTGDLEELLTSLFEGNDPDIIAQFDCFLAPGAFGVYANLLAHNPGIRNVSLMRAGEESQWGDLRLKAIRAGHRDLTGRDGNTIGLRLELCDSKGESLCAVGVTSDTRWQPGLVEELSGVDLLVLHLGGIYARDLSSNEYAKNHLGVKGTAELVSALAIQDRPPRVALLSEIGKELEYERVKLCSILGEICGLEVFPAELGMRVSLPSLRPVCDSRGCSAPATRWGTDPHDRRRICVRCDDCTEPLEAQEFMVK